MRWVAYAGAVALIVIVWFDGYWTGQRNEARRHVRMQAAAEELLAWTAGLGGRVRTAREHLADALRKTRWPGRG